MDASARPLRVLIMAAELSPYAKTGEVADVVGALALALHQLGHDVRVAIPRYADIAPEQFGLTPLIEALPTPMERHQDIARVYQAQLGEVPVYLVDSAKYFGRQTMNGHLDDAERFIFFCRAALEALRRPELDWRPDIIHCHDWQTAIVPNWLRTLYAADPFYHDIATVFTVHRASHQGIFGYRILQVAGIETYGFIYHSDLADLNDVVNLLGRGIYLADAVTTVSERYAQELQTPEFGERLDPLLREKKDRFWGILNGIDTDAYNPATDLYIASRYDLESLHLRPANKRALQESASLDVNPAAPLLGMVSRLSDEKGLDLLTGILDPLMANLNVQIAILGVGEPKYHTLLAELKARYPHRLGLWLTFNDAIARLIFAGSDLYLMPSRVEPCGLGHLRAMRYGSVPVVRAVGGLTDTVRNYDPAVRSGNGFSFAPYDPWALYTAIVRAVEVYRHRDLWALLQGRCMAHTYSTLRAAQRYVEVYRRAQAWHGNRNGA